jgi:hypothetical protein
MQTVPESVAAGKRLILAFHRAKIVFENDIVAVDAFFNTRADNDGKTYRQMVLHSDEGLESVIQKMDQRLVNS